MDKDVFKTSSGRLKKVTTSYDQTRRRQDVFQKTFDLRRLEDVRFTTSWRRLIFDFLKTFDWRRFEGVCKTTLLEQRRSDFYTTSKEIIFSYHIQKIWSGSAFLNLHKSYFTITCEKFDPGKAGSLFCTAGIPLCCDEFSPCNCINPPKWDGKVMWHMLKKVN